MGRRGGAARHAGRGARRHRTGARGRKTVSGRRWVPLGLGVTALLVVAGIASHGLPLAGGRGSGPTATFFNYVATTIAIAAVVMLGLCVYLSLSHRWSSGGSPRRTRNHHIS